MAISYKTLLCWSLIPAILALLFNSNKMENTLGSLRTNPSTIYSEDFYPNGTYLDTPVGTMRYWLMGNEGGQRVVLIHGITTGSCIYDKLARDLADQGYHVLVYDLWGRGYSDGPDAQYDDSIYTSQLVMLLQEIHWDKCHVVGLSLGGGIAAAFTDAYPDMVNKLILLAPAGLMRAKDVPKAALLLKLPLVYQIITRPAIKTIVRYIGEKYAKVTYSLPHDTDVDTAATLKKVTTIATSQFDQHPGFMRAFIRSAMNFPFCTLKESFERVGQQERSILVIWGDHDKTVPYPSHLKLESLLPRAEISIFKGEGHEVIITQWKQVNELIHQFLSKV
ncbi:Alpha/Beta hydrolase protein [Pilobolus umbonatus]|nr:Alpha/Beta hydrolase protein [Pilobolus umbonatus]